MSVDEISLMASSALHDASPRDLVDMQEKERELHGMTGQKHSVAPFSGPSRRASLRSNADLLIWPDGTIAKVWSVAMAVATFWVAVLVPMEASGLHDIHTGVAVALKTFYVLDILFQLNTAYQSDLVLSAGTKAVDLAESWYVTDRVQIAKRYMRRRHFIFDLLAALPVDLIILFGFPRIKDNTLVWSGVSLLSLLKLPSLQRRTSGTDTAVGEAVRQVYLTFDHSFLSILKYLCHFLLFAHWLACVW